MERGIEFTTFSLIGLCERTGMLGDETADHGRATREQSGR